MNGRNLNQIPKNYRPRTLVAISALFLVLCFFLLFFTIANVHWIPVYVPNFPWRTELYLAAVETPLIVVMLLSFFLGGTVLSAAFSIIYQRTVQNQQVLKNYVIKLENELKKTQRLVSTTKKIEPDTLGEH